MNFHILGLFPDILNAYFSHSLLGKARKKGLVRFFYHQLRDFAQGKHAAVDGRPYGGGSGMVLMPGVVCDAVRAIRREHGVDHVVLTSPSGVLLTPKKAEALSRISSVLFLCPRYEGVDQRAIDLVVDEEISIGDYVVSSGELAAGVMIDTICRYVPGVIGSKDAVRLESHQEGLLEYPHYTRPEVYENIPVPKVLVSGDHKKIEAWRRRESLRKTWGRRPDLLKRARLTDEELEFVKGLIHKV